MLNELDGFNQHPRLSIPFDGDIDLSTATSENIFLVEVPERADEPPVGASCDSDAAEVDGEPSIGRLVGINQIVWDPEAHTLHARADEALEEHARYVLVVSRGVRDTNGTPIAASRNFETYRRDLCQLGDPESVWYRRQLIRAEWAARRAGVQTARHRGGQLVPHAELHVPDAPAARRSLRGAGAGAGRLRAWAGGRAHGLRARERHGRDVQPPGLDGADVLARGRPAHAAALRPGRRRHDRVRPLHRPGLPHAPGRVDRAVRDRHGRAGADRHADGLLQRLPAGRHAPAGRLAGRDPRHRLGRHKNLQMGGTTSQFAARGVALIAINIAGHGYGPLSTLTVARTDGPALTFPAGGRATDQSGDGAIGLDEGFLATGARGSRDLYDGYAQTAADLMQLVRVIQAGVDVDGDGAPDLDASRISVLGLVDWQQLRHRLRRRDARGHGGGVRVDRRPGARAPAPQPGGARRSSAAGSPRGRRRCSTARPA